MEEGWQLLKVAVESKNGIYTDMQLNIINASNIKKF